MSKLTLFLSWQSDVPENRSLLRQKIDDALKVLSKDSAYAKYQIERGESTRYKEKEFILNIANSYNTYGDLKFHTSLITVVRTKKNIHKAKINTNDIIQVEFVE